MHCEVAYPRLRPRAVKVTYATRLKFGEMKSKDGGILGGPRGTVTARFQLIR